MSCHTQSIVASHERYYNDCIKFAAAGPRRCWAAVRDVLHQTESQTFRSDVRCSRLCDSFRLSSLTKSSYQEDRQVTSWEHTGWSFKLNPHHIGLMLVDISPPSNDDICQLILSMPSKSSPMNGIPASVIKSCVNVFAPLICRRWLYPSLH